MPKSADKGWKDSRLSLLYIRILIINLIVLAIPVIGFIGADRYRDGLIESEVDSLRREAVIMATSLGQGATEVTESGRPELAAAKVVFLTRILERETSSRVRLFGRNEELVTDNYLTHRRTGVIKVAPIRDNQGVPLLTWLFDLGSKRSNTPLYEEQPVQKANHYPEVTESLKGKFGSAVRVDETGNLVLSVAVPVRHYRAVLGGLMLSSDQTDIESEVNALRVLIIQLFLVAFLATVVLSIYLTWTIARPIRRMAFAADRIRTGKARQVKIPDFSFRRDEIGDLSMAMRDMTESLWDRLDAIERFAADVSHELKNPLTSLRSAVETAAMIKDPEKFERLMPIILQDVTRLDRLITDISNASRLDAEMSRADGRRLSITEMLHRFKYNFDMTRNEFAPKIEVHVPKDDGLHVLGLESRLGQVLANLVGNAASFSKAGDTLRLIADRGDKRRIIIMVEDEGPGLPAGKEDEIFSRFFTDRPEEQGFGNHSGLGLAICKQIIEAHRGSIIGESMTNERGQVTGARFTIVLPPYRAWVKEDQTSAPVVDPDETLE